jgi:hypothetical protein
MNKEVYKEEIFHDNVIQTNLPLHYERLLRSVLTTDLRFILNFQCTSICF